MRCYKCSKLNHGVVDKCWNCGTDLKRPPPGKPTQGSCSKCGSPQVQFFDSGYGQCLACRRTFKWMQDAPSEKDGPPEKKKFPMIILIVVIVIAVIVVGVVLAYFMLLEEDEEDEKDAAIIHTVQNSVPVSGVDTLISANLTYLPESEQYRELTVSLHWSYENPMDPSSLVEDSKNMDFIYIYSTSARKFTSTIPAITTNITGPVELTYYVRVWGLTTDSDGNLVDQTLALSSQRTIVIP